LVTPFFQANSYNKLDVICSQLDKFFSYCDDNTKTDAVIISEINIVKKLMDENMVVVKK